MRIASREIAHNQPPYIIAEIGVNHDGSVERALELVRAAQRAGADAVKFQFFRTDLLLSRAAAVAGYQRKSGESDARAMLRRLELAPNDLARCATLARELAIHAIVTVFSVPLVAEAERVGFDAYKTASPDIINKPLLEALVATGKPLIVSTGAADLDEVKRASGWVASARDRVAFLQCVSSYPTPAGGEEFGGIGALRDALRYPIGYSDHTTSAASGAEAVFHGACILEKHLTYSRAAAGPDHAASLDPGQFAEYGRLAHASRDLRPTSSGLLPRRKVVTEHEWDVRLLSRQSLTSTRSLPSGHRLGKDDLTIKRPGVGLPPFALADVVGRTLKRAVEADSPLVAEDLA